MAEPGARAVIAAVASTFTEFTVDGAGPGGDGPLDWAGYAGSLAAARGRSGEDESVVCGHGKIGGGEAGGRPVDLPLPRGPHRQPDQDRKRHRSNPQPRQKRIPLPSLKKKKR